MVAICCRMVLHGEQTWLSLTTIIAPVLLVLALLVSARTKMLRDLEVLEKVRTLNLDPEGALEQRLLDAFNVSFKMTYGWVAIAPSVMFFLGSTATAAGGTFVWLSFVRDSGWAWEVAGAIYIVFGVLLMLISQRLMKSPRVRSTTKWLTKSSEAAAPDDDAGQ